MNDNARTVEAAERRAAELKGSTDAIPHGNYCYVPLGTVPLPDGRTGLKTETCPYWASDPSKPEQERGYCAFLKTGDWVEGGTFLLWDKVKECGFNDEQEEGEDADLGPSGPDGKEAA